MHWGEEKLFKKKKTTKSNIKMHLCVHLMLLHRSSVWLQPGDAVWAREMHGSSLRQALHWGCGEERYSCCTHSSPNVISAQCLHFWKCTKTCFEHQLTAALSSLLLKLFDINRLKHICWKIYAVARRRANLNAEIQRGSFDSCQPGEV